MRDITKKLLLSLEFMLGDALAEAANNSAEGAPVITLQLDLEILSETVFQTTWAELRETLKGS